MPIDPAAVAGKLTDNERAVMQHMSDGEHVYPASYTAADAGVPFNETRKIIRQFRADGLARYGPLYNEDECRPQGSGTWLTADGLAVRHELEKEKQ